MNIFNNVNEQTSEHTREFAIDPATTESAYFNEKPEIFDVSPYSRGFYREEIAHEVTPKAVVPVRRLKKRRKKLPFSAHFRKPTSADLNHFQYINTSVPMNKDFPGKYGEIAVESEETVECVPTEESGEKEREISSNNEVEEEMSFDLLDWYLYSDRNDVKFSSDIVDGVKKRKRCEVDRFSFDQENQTKKKKYEIQASKKGRGKVLVLRE